MSRDVPQLDQLEVRSRCEPDDRAVPALVPLLDELEAEQVSVELDALVESIRVDDERDLVGECQGRTSS